MGWWREKLRREQGDVEGGRRGSVEGIGDEGRGVG